MGKIFNRVRKKRRKQVYKDYNSFKKEIKKSLNNLSSTDIPVLEGRDIEAYDLAIARLFVIRNNKDFILRYSPEIVPVMKRRNHKGILYNVKIYLKR